MRACVRACECACLRARVCVCVCQTWQYIGYLSTWWHHVGGLSGWRVLQVSRGWETYNGYEGRGLKRRIRREGGWQAQDEREDRDWASVGLMSINTTRVCALIRRTGRDNTLFCLVSTLQRRENKCACSLSLRHTQTHTHTLEQWRRWGLCSHFVPNLLTSILLLFIIIKLIN